MVTNEEVFDHTLHVLFAEVRGDDFFLLAARETFAAEHFLQTRILLGIAGDDDTIVFVFQVHQSCRYANYYFNYPTIFDQTYKNIDIVDSLFYLLGCR